MGFVNFNNQEKPEVVTYTKEMVLNALLETETKIKAKAEKMVSGLAEEVTLNEALALFSSPMIAMPALTKALNEASFEVHYSDGVRAFKKFGNEGQAVAFAKDLIKNKKGLQFVDVFKAGSGFHSTDDTDAIVAFWGDGSYTDNVSKKDAKLAAKKIEESAAPVNEAKKPKSWDTMFAMNAIKAYENGEFNPEDAASLAKWEKDYNGGIAPKPSFETYDIIAYAIATGKKPNGEPLKESVNEAKEWCLKFDLGKIDPVEFQEWAGDHFQRSHKVTVTCNGTKCEITGKGNDDRNGSSMGWVRSRIDKAWTIDKVVYESLNEGAVKQFEMDYKEMETSIKRGIGWIDPDYVEYTWDISSDAIDFELVKTEIFKRLINAGLLWTTDHTGEEKGKQVRSLRDLGLKESLIVEGQFSWFTHDTQEQIGSERENTITVYMFDNKGTKWKETKYDGYGRFGGKDYYELLAQMNGVENADRQDGIDLAFDKKKQGKILFPALVTNPNFNWKRHDFTEEAEHDPNQSWFVEEEDDDYDGYDESVVTEARSIKKIEKDYSQTVADMKATVDKWKAAEEGELKTSLLDKLKGLTTKKRQLEIEMDDAVSLKDIDAELVASESIKLSKAEKWMQLSEKLNRQLNEDLRTELKKYIKANEKELNSLADADNWDAIHNMLRTDFNVKEGSKEEDNLFTTFNFVF
jgi:hypothetical protein